MKKSFGPVSLSLALGLTLLAVDGHYQVLWAEPIEPPAKAYLEAALSLMEEKYVYRHSVDWGAVRQSAMKDAADAEEPMDTYEAIRNALKKLGDRHSQLILTEELTQAEAKRREARHLPPSEPGAKVSSPFRERTVPEAKTMERQRRKYGLVVVPMFQGPDLAGFATTIQHDLAKVVDQHLCAWIVDLRGNRGGNMWPMLAGIGPLLGAGKAGQFFDADGKQMGNWMYENGRAWLDSAVGGSTVDVRITGSALTGIEQSPVAVLIDGATGSSGEAIAIAFRGRPETRFFGVKTSGAASGPHIWPLSDDAKIMLASVAMADRSGRTYEIGVVPDSIVEYRPGSSGEDSQVEAALAWLEHACETR